MTVSHGKPYAGKPHVRFDEGAGVPGKGRSALLHEYEWWSRSVNVSRGGANLPTRRLWSPYTEGRFSLHGGFGFPTWSERGLRRGGWVCGW